MALSLASDSTRDNFKTLIEASYLRECEWEVLNNPKLKPSEDGMFSKVKIVSPDLVMTGAKDFIIILNEDLFDKLTDEYQTLFILKTLAQIGYDTEKGGCVKVKPNYIEYNSIISKFGYDTLVAFKLAVQQICDKQKEEN